MKNWFIKFKLQKFKLMAYIKIQEELENINYDPESDFAAGPVNSKDLFLWNATILGPDDTPYEGG